MLSERKWSNVGVARLLLGVLVTMCLGMGLGGLALTLVPDLSEAQKLFASTVIAAISLHGGALVWIALFLRGENLTWSQAFGFKAPGGSRAVLIGLVAGALVVPVVLGCEQLSDTLMQFFNLKSEVQVMVQELQRGDLPAGQRLLLGVMAVFLAPIVEEMLFRGILYPTIKQTGRPRLAFWGTAIFFGAFHFSLVHLLPLILLAVVLALLYEHTDNLLAPIMAHSTFNAVNYLMVHFPT